MVFFNNVINRFIGIYFSNAGYQLMSIWAAHLIYL